MPENMQKGMYNALNRMAREIAAVMDGKVYGIWLYGSVVLDDFRPGWSDIDFVALTNETIAESQADRLLTLRQDLLKKEPGNPYYHSFEGVIAGLDEYRSGSFVRLVYWGTSGQRITDHYVKDPFSSFELARYGKPVYGDRPWILQEPAKEDLIRAVRNHYECIRKYAAQTDESLYSCGWLLDIARCVYTVRYHDVIAKTKAGIWALEERLFQDEAPLRRTIEIRVNPLSFRGQPGLNEWLRGLGPVVQRYADVLERELENARIPV